MIPKTYAASPRTERVRHDPRGIGIRARPDRPVLPALRAVPTFTSVSHLRLERRTSRACSQKCAPRSRAATTRGDVVDRLSASHPTSSTAAGSRARAGRARRFGAARNDDGSRRRAPEAPPTWSRGALRTRRVPPREPGDERCVRLSGGARAWDAVAEERFAAEQAGHAPRTYLAFLDGEPVASHARSFDPECPAS